jgi:hypothetical protein
MIDIPDFIGPGVLQTVQTVLQIDRLGQPHLLYRKPTTRASTTTVLHYAHRTSLRWLIDHVDPAVDVIALLYTMLLDSTDQPVIAYVAPNGTLRVVR